MDESEWLTVRFEEHRPHLWAVALSDAGLAQRRRRRRPGRLGAGQPRRRRRGRGPQGVADDDRRSGLPQPAPFADSSARAAHPRSHRESRSRGRSRGGGCPGGLGRLRPSDRDRRPRSRGTPRLRVARRLRPALRRDRGDSWPYATGNQAARQQSPPPSEGGWASRARARSRPSTKVVDAFFAAGRAGDFDALVSVLHADVVARVDLGKGGSKMARGAAAVARHARQGADVDGELHHVLVNGGAGVVITRAGLPIAVMAFTVAADRIIKIDTIADPDRVAELAAPASLASPKLRGLRVALLCLTRHASPLAAS